MGGTGVVPDGRRGKMGWDGQMRVGVRWTWGWGVISGTQFLYLVPHPHLVTHPPSGTPFHIWYPIPISGTPFSYLIPHRIVFVSSGPLPVETCPLDNAAE